MDKIPDLPMTWDTPTDRILVDDATGWHQPECPGIQASETNKDEGRIGQHDH